MGKKSGKKRNRLIYPVMAVMVLILIHSFIASKRDAITYDELRDFSDGWEMVTDEEHLTVTLTRPIDGEMAGRTVNFHSYDSFVTAYVDGNEFYSFGSSTIFCKSPASAEQLIEIPGSSTGSILTIVITAVYESAYTTDFDIRLGATGTIIVNLVTGEIKDILLSVLIVALATILLILYYQMKVNSVEDKRALFLGIFGLIFVLGSCSDLFLWRFFVPYGAVQYLTYYFALYILPLILICYLEELSGHKLDIVFYMQLGLIAAFTVLQLTGIAEYTQTLAIYGSMVGAEMVATIIFLIRQNIQTSRLHHIGLCILAAALIINVGLYVLGVQAGKSLFITKLGISVYMVIAMRTYVLQMVTELTTVRNAELLKKQAYTDHLTELGNRYAFMERVNSIELSRLSIVSFDVNNLKYYNDNFGHMTGDKLITTTAEILRKLYGTVYRTGGDEFMAVMEDADTETLQKLKKKLFEMTKKAGSAELVIEIACGYSSYMPEDISYEDVVRRADEYMYANKRELKAGSVIKSVR